MQLAQRPDERPSLQFSIVFRSGSAEGVASMLSAYLDRFLVKVVSTSVLIDTQAPTSEDGQVALIVTLQED
jgi:hypothetical protein